MPSRRSRTRGALSTARSTVAVLVGFIGRCFIVGVGGGGVGPVVFLICAVSGEGIVFTYHPVATNLSESGFTNCSSVGRGTEVRSREEALGIGNGAKVRNHGNWKSKTKRMCS